jgi:hypothetical protein
MEGKIAFSVLFRVSGGCFSALKFNHLAAVAVVGRVP